jgi:hypothetical protein
MSNPKQIAVAGSVNGAIMYVVPAGKKFQGTLHSDTTSKYAGVTPAGGVIMGFILPTVNVVQSSVLPMPITLVAGSVVTSQSPNSIFLIGVESDL